MFSMKYTVIYPKMQAGKEHTEKLHSHESRDLQSPGSCRGYCAVVRGRSRVILGASGSCRRELHYIYF